MPACWLCPRGNGIGEHHARVGGACGDGGGALAGAKTDGKQVVAHLVARVPDVAAATGAEPA